MLSLNDFVDHRAVTLTISLRHEGGHDRARAAAMVTKCDLIRLPSMCVVVFHRGCFLLLETYQSPSQSIFTCSCFSAVRQYETMSPIWLDPTTGAAFRKATRLTRSPQSFTSMAGKSNSPLAAISLISCGMYLDSGFVVLSTVRQLSILVVHNLSLRAFVHPQGRIATVVVVSFVAAICTRHGEHLLGKAPPILWKDLTFQPVVLRISWVPRSDTTTLDHAKMEIKSSKSSSAHKRADVTVKSGPVRCWRRHR